MCSGCVCVEEQESNISIASTITFQPKMVELISYLYLYANYNAVINTEGQKDVESFQEGRQKQENKRNEKFNLLCNKEVNLEQLQNSLLLQFSACTQGQGGRRTQKAFRKADKSRKTKGMKSLICCLTRKSTWNSYKILYFYSFLLAHRGRGVEGHRKLLGRQTKAGKQKE